MARRKEPREIGEDTGLGLELFQMYQIKGYLLLHL
jgi:hypothetical protein